MSETIASRPLPKRPQNGLLAWEATIGYISTQYSLDAMLTIHAYPFDNGEIGWGAAATWGQNGEEVRDLPTLGNALQDLWRQVDQHHVIFEHREAVIKRPSNYADNEWLDTDTKSILERILQVTGAVYSVDWLLVLLYQPVESADTRFQARLIAQGETVKIGGQGASLRDSCRDLYRNAAHQFAAQSGKNLDEIL
ncbi:MAG: hypothetical protein ABI690_32575 [Chloroflexota bacterium]